MSSVMDRQPALGQEGALSAPLNETALTWRAHAEGVVQQRAERAIPFITALWASGGLAILASLYIPVQLVEITSDLLPIIVPFVLGTYLTSYWLGAKLLVRRSVRGHFFKAFSASFFVSEAVVFVSTFLASTGSALHTLLSGGAFGQIDLEIFLYIPMIMVFYGAMFCLPLALALATHIRLWTRHQDKRLETHLDSAELEQRALLELG